MHCVHCFLDLSHIVGWSPQGLHFGLWSAHMGEGLQSNARKNDTSKIQQYSLLESLLTCQRHRKLSRKWGFRVILVVLFLLWVVLICPKKDEQDIKQFCRLTYDVKFPMFEKISVSGDAAHPIYQELATQGGGYPRWNFHKYLLGHDGKVVSSFPTRMRPDDPRLIAAIEKLL